MKTWAWGAASALAAGPLALGLAACGNGQGGSTGGTGGTTSSAGGGCGATVFSAMAECQDCVAAECCAELSACTTGTPCAALLDCLTANKCSAGDATCITTCEDQNNAGVTPAQALEGCYSTRCSMETVCQTGAICQSGLMVPNVQCGMCLGASCCSEWTACAADATCSGCATSQGMSSGCADDSLYTAASMCELNTCSQDCTQICDTGLSTNDPPCDLCLTANCCAAFEQCIGDSTCDVCLLSSSPPAGCSADMAFTMATTCQSSSCATQCMTGG
jgi:hypothetical protein